MDLDDIKNNPEQIKLLINILSSLLPEGTGDTTKKTARKKTVKSNNKNVNNIKTARGKAQGSGVNKFDDMPEKNSHKADIAIDRKLSKFPPTERNRHFHYVPVQCRCCGKKEQVNPALVTERDRYKCNKCSISAG